MGEGNTPKLRDGLRGQVGDHLRSVVVYTADDYEVRYLRDDVADGYDTAEFERGIEEMRFEALEADYINDVFGERHGDLHCNATFFEAAVELNFVVDDTTGLAIAIDADYFGRQDSLVTYVLGFLDATGLDE